MKKKIKIVVVGIGGVGGYFGGLLAKKYEASESVEIDFIARGEHLNQIQKNGLKVIKGDDVFTAHPHLATNDFEQIGIADYIIICTKSYDLKETIIQLKPCIDQDTILLPLLNGVDASDEILSILPKANVLNGCVFIISRLTSPGVIENLGNIQKLYFGVDGALNQQILLLGDVLTHAGIDVIVSNKISTAIWEKFIFISPTATATSYFDYSIGKVLEENMNIILSLIEEVKNLALAKNIIISADITNKTLSTMHSMNYETTSSMHSDYLSGKSTTELESLTGYIVHEAEKLGVATPTYNELYQKLLSRK